MKAVVQRVSEAEVRVDRSVVAHIHSGFLVLLGVAAVDTDEDAKDLGEKVANLRVMPDEKDKMNLSLKDVHGEVLVVSQFTLVSDTSSRRPSFVQAAPADEAERLYTLFVETLRSTGLKVKTGSFGAHMQVTLTNDGPVTLVLDTSIDAQ